ncbi:MAG TPA: Slp family lipoprotein [Nitrospira sp.]|nr:Slp family lipoprotein [Nitrospira sp.]
MTRYCGTMLLIAGLALAGCGHGQIFPSKVADGVDKDFDFTAWRNVPNAKTDRKVQLGGRIVQANTDKGGVVIIVTQLPIVERPAYGPKDTGRRSGEFAVTYAGTLDPKWLAPGHRLVVIGITGQAKTVVVDDVQRSLPSLTANCVHIWRTGGKEIADFPYNIGGGYEPLEEDTHCTS